MNIQRLTPELNQSYEAFLRHSGQSTVDCTFYYSLKFKSFLEEVLQCTPHYLAGVDNGQVQGILPIMASQGQWGVVYNSLPFFGSYGGIIARDPAVFQALEAAYSRLVQADGAAATLIENPFNDSTTENSYASLHRDAGDWRIGQWTPLDTVPGEDIGQALMNRFDATTRRNIKKALRRGVQVSIDNSAMEWLKTIHYENMGAINGRAKPGIFFDCLDRHFTAGTDYNLYLAHLDNQPIAVLLLFYFNQTVEYYIPGTLEQYRTDQPLSLIIYQAMKDAAARGFKCWNWGGTWPSQEGVHKFKRKWGTQEKKYRYHITINNNDLLLASKQALLDTYPYFYVVPFDRLREG